MKFLALRSRLNRSFLSSFLPFFLSFFLFLLFFFLSLNLWTTLRRKLSCEKRTLNLDYTLLYFCYLIFTSTLSSCHVLANHFLHVFFQILILGAVSIFLLSHIYKYAVIISCVSQSCFSMYFSNLNLRSRYYIFLQYSSGPEED